MGMKTSYYDEIFEAFKNKCPGWYEQSDGYAPKHTHAIRVRLKNGDQVDYNIRTDSYRYRKRGTAQSIKPDNITDEACRDAFAYNLVELMKTKGFGQATLAERTGLSKAIISKYINKLSTPSITNLIKIAIALDCDPEELMD